MKKLKFIGLILLLIITIFSFIKCSDNKDTIENQNSENLIKEKLAFHLNEISEVNKVLIKDIYSVQNSKKKNVSIKEIEEYLKKSITKNTDISYYSFLENQKILKNKGLEYSYLKDTNLPEKSFLYLKELVDLDNKSDYLGILNLSKKYKKEYSENPSGLESLIGLFSVIKIYENDLIYKKRGCNISGAAVGGAAISGAISGAIWGFKLGSWFGPAGTALGTAGGAIAGAVVSSIVAIGVQGVLCESGYVISELQTFEKEYGDIMNYEIVNLELLLP